VSKPGHTFDEAIASGLPLVSLPPPPGSEVVQYRLLDEWHVGRGVRDLDDLAVVVTRLLADPAELSALRQSVGARRRAGSARSVARWIQGAASPRATAAVTSITGPHDAPRLALTAGGRR
jgi:UDP-N-acetylglucosamine:LPS N-acetylglucosamine transferase